MVDETHTASRKITFAVRNPSENSEIRQISSLSGMIHITGRKSAFTDSGSSVRPAYPGFIVMNIPTFPSIAIFTPSNCKKHFVKFRFKYLLYKPKGIHCVFRTANTRMTNRFFINYHKLLELHQ